jgi:hypothetical protein
MVARLSSDEPMNRTDTQSEFLKLRAKHWGRGAHAAHLNVSPRTVVEWNLQMRDEIATLRALDLEALQEKLLASHEQTEDLFPLSSLPRAEICKVRLDPELNWPEPLDVAPLRLP